MTQPKTLLIDRRNMIEMLPVVIAEVANASIIGLDCETHDDNRHEGLNKFCGYDPKTRKKAGNKPLVFDMRRTVMTGFSIYAEGSETAYYINLNHADAENRVPWEVAKHILAARKTGAHFVAHNAPFELAAFGSCYQHELDNIICSMQMAVSAYGPDEYEVSKFRNASLGPMAGFIQDLQRLSKDYDSSEDRELKGELGELASKITAKESSAAHSYNGWTSSFGWGYGLKRAVKSHFDVDMATFKETLGDRAHMGQLTGEEVSAYGADDAYWCVRLFRHLLGHMQRRCPDAVLTFFQQENPMIHCFADIRRGGIKLNREAVETAQVVEREEFARLLRLLKSQLREVQFRPEPDERLVKWEKWYGKNGDRYRKLITNWLSTPDTEDALTQCQQVRSPVSNAWADELGMKQSSGVNLVHYMPMRVILYDLLRLPLEINKGKVQSDGETRGKLRDKANKASDRSDGWRETSEIAAKALETMTTMAGVEQRMKLYITPYLHLLDPETSRVYPDVNSMLATRRMASSNPNGMQLAKRGHGRYVRGFYEADDEDHVLVSDDWSAIELLIIGELSGDQEFSKAYGQKPHGDLHAGASADILAVEVAGLTEEAFKGLRRGWETRQDWLREYQILEENSERLFTNLKGEELSVGNAYKYWRTEVGKGANFNFWYSGWLGTIGERMGWSQETTARAVERYTSRFWGAEAWRRGIIAQGQRCGWVQLPDGQRRYRYEATDQWRQEFVAKWPLFFDQPGHLEFNGVINEIARRIQKRSHNQLVNAMVQGTCATLAKRTILRVRQECAARGWGPNMVRFLMPIHDELLYSVHRSIVVEFIELLQRCMQEHEALFPTLVLDSSPAVGLTFEPWHPEEAPTGQVELYEPPALVVGSDRADTRLDNQGITDVVNWLFDRREQLRMAA